jgi:hypothetical protein
MVWTYLFVASRVEIVFALWLKYIEGFTRLGPSMLTVTAGAASFLILSQALRTLPVGTASVLTLAPLGERVWVRGKGDGGLYPHPHPLPARERVKRRPGFP